MSKSPDAFRTISEVAEWLDIQAHVLRFWESKFNQVKPVKRAGGRRYYRPTDMLLLGGIQHLLHDKGLSIKDVQAMIREKGVQEIQSMSRPLDGEEPQPPAPSQKDSVWDDRPRTAPETVEAAQVEPVPETAAEPTPQATPEVAEVPVQDIASTETSEVASEAAPAVQSSEAATPPVAQALPSAAEGLTPPAATAAPQNAAPAGVATEAQQPVAPNPAPEAPVSAAPPAQPEGLPQAEGFQATDPQPVASQTETTTPEAAEPEAAPAQGFQPQPPAPQPSQAAQADHVSPSVASSDTETGGAFPAAHPGSVPQHAAVGGQMAMPIDMPRSAPPAPSDVPHSGPAGTARSAPPVEGQQDFFAGAEPDLLDVQVIEDSAPVGPAAASPSTTAMPEPEAGAGEDQGDAGSAPHFDVKPDEAAAVSEPAAEMEQVNSMEPQNAAAADLPAEAPASFAASEEDFALEAAPADEELTSEPTDQPQATADIESGTEIEDPAAPEVPEISEMTADAVEDLDETDPLAPQDADTVETDAIETAPLDEPVPDDPTSDEPTPEEAALEEPPLDWAEDQPDDFNPEAPLADAEHPLPLRARQVEVLDHISAPVQPGPLSRLAGLAHIGAQDQEIAQAVLAELKSWRPRA